MPDLIEFRCRLSQCILSFSLLSLYVFMHLPNTLPLVQWAYRCSSVHVTLWGSINWNDAAASHHIHATRIGWSGSHTVGVQGGTGAAGKRWRSYREGGHMAGSHWWWAFNHIGATVLATTILRQEWNYWTLWCALHYKYLPSLPPPHSFNLLAFFCITSSLYSFPLPSSIFFSLFLP